MFGKGWFRASTFVVLALWLTGCASSGNEVLRSQDISAVNSSIIDGQTTRDDIQRIYGQPARVSFLSEKNVVVRHAMTDNTNVVKRGLTNTDVAPAGPVQPQPPPTPRS